MIFLIIVAIIVFVVGTGALVWYKVEQNKQLKRYGMPRKKFVNMSDAAMDIITAYRSLPADNQPIDDINSLLEALDTKHGIKNVDKHLKGGHFSNGVAHDVGWWCRRDGEECEFKEYHQLHNGIEEVKAAVAEQKHALAMSRVQGGLEAVKALTEQLKTERKLINEVTMELTQ